MYTNSYIFGSSRGRSMGQVKCKQVNILPGGTYIANCDLAEKQLRNNTDPKIVYFIALKSTCDVNLLSKLSIIFKEWRVVNNMYRGGARV